MALKSSVLTLVTFLGLRKLKTVWLEKLSNSSAPVGRTLLMPTPLFRAQLFCGPAGASEPA